MNYYELLSLGTIVNYVTNVITLGLFRFAVIAACIKYVFF